MVLGLLLQSCHINYKTITHISFQHSFVSRIDVLDIDSVQYQIQYCVRHKANISCVSECLYTGAGNASAVAQQAGNHGFAVASAARPRKLERHLFLINRDKYCKVMRRRNRVDDKMKTVANRFQLFFVAC